jgi:hypothetical protein
MQATENRHLLRASQEQLPHHNYASAHHDSLSLIRV